MSPRFLEEAPNPEAPVQPEASQPTTSTLGPLGGGLWNRTSVPPRTRTGECRRLKGPSSRSKPCDYRTWDGGGGALRIRGLSSGILVTVILSWDA